MYSSDNGAICFPIGPGLSEVLFTQVTVTTPSNSTSQFLIGTKKNTHTHTSLAPLAMASLLPLVLEGINRISIRQTAVLVAVQSETRSMMAFKQDSPVC